MASRTKLALTLACVLISLLVPMAVTGSFYMFILIMGALNAVLAVSLNLMLGYIGEKSLGHAAFFGIGAYAAAMLSVHFGLTGPLGLLAAAILTMACAAIIGIPALRLRGPYFAIVTLGFVLIVQLLVTNGGSATGGPSGLAGIARLQWNGIGGPFEFTTDTHYYYASIALFWGALFISILAANSRMGRAWVAIRENFDLAESVGIDAFYYKMIAFLMGAGLAGLVGALYAHYIGFVSPRIFDTWTNVLIVAMVIIGGEGTILGPVIGAVIMTALPELLRFAEGYRMLLYGLFLLAAIMFAPQGLLGLTVIVVGKLKARFHADH
jgi:branched-chain amino acid transport system permease protein